MKLTFYGGAKMVTGANYLLEEGGTKVLIDCGLNQGPSYCEKLNFEPFAYDIKSIDAVLITHAHVDHIGRLPSLYKAGFRGKIYSISPTKDLAEYLLIDSQHLLEKDTREKGLPPLYNLQDINETMKLWERAHYHKKFRIKDFEIEYYDAGHILGSGSILITGSGGKKIVFSGDLGNVASPLVKDTEIINEADYALIESAYGGRLHEDIDIRKDILEDLIEETVKAKGVLMIPAFAMERTQELLYELNELVANGRIPRVPIYVDSPLAIKLTGVYEKFSGDAEYFDKEALEFFRKGKDIFNFPGLKVCLTTEESKEINNAPSPKIIIAGAGMSNGGRILHHEMRYLSDPKSAILFIGYQATGSLGRQIMDGAKTVRISGVEVMVRCKIKSISGYSAHADQAKLLEWLKPMRLSLKKVFIVQGEEDQMVPLFGKIRDILAIDAEIPSIGEEVML